MKRDAAESEGVAAYCGGKDCEPLRGFYFA